MNVEGWVNHSEVGRRLGVSRSMVGRYCVLGLQVAAGRDSDRRLNWPLVEQWHATFINPRRSGSFAFRQRQQAAERLAAEAK